MKRVFCIITVLLMVISLNGMVLAGTQIRIAGYGGNDQNIVEELIIRYVEPAVADDGIKVIYEPIADDYPRYILNSLSAGTAADLFYMDIFWAKNVIKTGTVEPLDNYLLKSDILSKEDIIPSLLEGFTVDGKLYGIPKDFNSLALFYNKDLFDIAGVPYPNSEDTWKTLKNKLNKVVEVDEEFIGMALQPEFARMGALAYANGWEPFAGDKTDLMDPKFKEAFLWYTSLKEKGLGRMPADIGQGWGGGAFATGTTATCLEGAWIIGFLRDQAPNLNYGATLLPKSPETGKRGNFIFTVAWGMNANSSNKEAAFKVLEALTSPEAQQWVLERGLAIPSRKSLVNNPYFEKETKEAQANKIVFMGASDGYVKPYSFREYGGEWMDPINDALNEVLSGQTGVDEALKKAQETLNQDVMK